MFEGLRDVLAAEPRVAYALLFGSTARGSAHRSSDLDVAVGLHAGTALPVLEIGALINRMEGAAGQPVDLVLLDEAPPSVAYRVFRDGRTLFSRDDRALAARRARAVLEYLDFQPFEELFVRSVLEPRRGR